MNTTINATSLQVLVPKTRQVFFGIFLVLFILAIIGNLCAIKSICKRKCNVLQKTCTISLALSDILAITVFTTNTLETFSHELMNWTLGEFLCHFIPMGQVFSTTASSIALLVIALDRYQNVIYALSKRWNPSLFVCVSSALGFWLVCIVVSYPMYEYFSYYEIIIRYPNGDLEDASLCVSTNKLESTVFYITIVIIIFIPILSIFVWFYYNIAKLIWRHRKPLALRYSQNGGGESELENSNTKSTEISTLDKKQLKSIIKKGRNVQVERKIRTFKIIVVLMIVFIICRLPYWIYVSFKLSDYKVFKEHKVLTWNLQYSLIALNVTNCVLNPLLYTFLNQTILALKTVNDLWCKICGWCFSTEEFEEFEKQNPFVVENFEQKKTQVQTEPPKTVRNSRVKFEDVAHLQMYSQGTGPKF